VAQIMFKHHNFRTFSFAQILKDWALSLFYPLGMRQRHLFGTQADKAEPIPGIVGPDGEPQTGRRILELLGTEVGRLICPTVWVALAMRVALQAQRQGNPVVFTDARFPNEFEAIRAAGGVVWEVVKVGGEQRSTGHASDTAWREIPKDALVLARAGDLEALRLEVEQLLALGGRRHSGLVNQP
jgi:hypothetical protein